MSPPQYPADTIEHSYNLTGLEEFTNYSIAISAVNVAGMGPPSVSVLATTEEDGMLPPYSGTRLIQHSFG